MRGEVDAVVDVVPGHLLSQKRPKEELAHPKRLRINQLRVSLI